MVEWSCVENNKIYFFSFFLLASTHVALDTSTSAVNEAVSVKEDASSEECEDEMVAGGITPPSTTPPPQEDKEMISHWTKSITETKTNYIAQCSLKRYFL